MVSDGSMLVGTTGFKCQIGHRHPGARWNMSSDARCQVIRNDEAS